jgi:hypothetical protein
MEDHVHRAPRLGERGLLNVRIGITPLEWNDSTHPRARLGQPPIGEWNDDDYDVLADGAVVGRMPKDRVGV